MSVVDCMSSDAASVCIERWSSEIRESPFALVSLVALQTSAYGAH